MNLKQLIMNLMKAAGVAITPEIEKNIQEHVKDLKTFTNDDYTKHVDKIKTDLTTDLEAKAAEKTKKLRIESNKAKYSADKKIVELAKKLGVSWDDVAQNNIDYSEEDPKKIDEAIKKLHKKYFPQTPPTENPPIEENQYGDYEGEVDGLDISME